MSRLNDLYKAMDTLRKEGLPVNEDLERKANEIEEEIIKQEILPILTKNIEPALQPVQRGQARDMAVFFPDGTIIAENTAADTLVTVVKKIGVSKVRQVVEGYSLKFCKVPVISNRRDAKYGKSQKDLGNGWLLITHCNNSMKKVFIQNVSEALNLGIRVTLNEEV